MFHTDTATIRKLINRTFIGFFHLYSGKQTVQNIRRSFPDEKTREKRTASRLDAYGK